MSPTFFRSSGKTTTVKGQVLWSWQKVRNVRPLVPSATWNTVPLTHWVVPTCLLASANETQSCLEGLRAEQTPLIARTVARKEVRTRKRIMTEAAERCVLRFIVGVEERPYAKQDGKFCGDFPKREHLVGRRFWRTP